MADDPRIVVPAVAWVLRATRLGALLSTWRGRFIFAFLILQLLLPLRYYVAHRDMHDERFAWRMFSPMRMVTCSPALQIDGKRQNLANEFHEAWISIAKRGRFVVIEAMAAHLCERHPNSSVVFSLQCSYLDREPQSFGGYDMCKVPLL
jgi:hypothetical protein